MKPKFAEVKFQLSFQGSQYGYDQKRDNDFYKLTCNVEQERRRTFVANLCFVFSVVFTEGGIVPSIAATCISK